MEIKKLMILAILIFWKKKLKFSSILPSYVSERFVIKQNFPIGYSSKSSLLHKGVLKILIASDMERKTITIR